ncbi:hypothetical protein ACOQFO_04300 [Ureibacillus sp. MALMAid1270]|uniref:hypothetical protein n=1 Tax=Ureibacillus sp. MALMAid1270 TaxID=3411629 RepID=UPI003BA6EFDA
MKMFMISWIFLLAIAFFILAFFLEPLFMVGSYLFISFMMFLWGYFEMKKEMDRRKEEILEESEEFIKGIPHTKYTLSDDLLNSLLIDETSNTFYIAKREYTDEDFECMSFPFSKLLEVAILEDGRVKYLFPRDGIIGGTVNEEGKPIINVFEADEYEYDEEDEDTIKKVTLKLVVDDFSNHTIEYVFLDNDDSIEKDSEEYKDLMMECTNWYQMLSLAINQYKHEKRLIGHWM